MDPAFEHFRWFVSVQSLSATQVFSQAAGSVVRIAINREDGSEMIGSGFVAALEQAPGISPTKEPIVRRAELVNPRSSPARASPTATAASHIEDGVEVRRALTLTSGTQTPKSAPTPQQAPVNQTTQPALAEAERLLNQTCNDLRLSLSPKNRKVLKVEQLKWRKKRGNVRNNPSEYLEGV